MRNYIPVLRLFVRLHFFHWCNNLLFRFLRLSFLFFNSSLIGYWLLLKCAITRSINWRRYCMCININMCIICNKLIWVAFSVCLWKKMNVKSSHICPLVFIEEFFVDFRTRYIKRSLLLSKESLVYSFLCLSLSLAQISKILLSMFLEIAVVS